MKALQLLAAFAAMAITAVAFPQTIRIGETEFALASTAKTKAETVREYIPEGQRLDHWTELVSVRTFPQQKDPEAYLKRLIRSLQGNKPPSRFELYFKKTTDEHVIDFLVFGRSSGKITFGEWNIMLIRFDEGRGLVVHQYAFRDYGFGKEGFSDRIGAKRKTMLPIVVEGSFDEVEGSESNKPVETTSVTRPDIRESCPFASALRSVSHG